VVARHKMISDGQGPAPSPPQRGDSPSWPILKTTGSHDSFTYRVKRASHTNISAFYRVFL
jgi:hypothetical protein